ncbi:cupin domain-containing protein [Roseomonas sp. AR75]|uniref:cupin domain-containing protein n=1 Tax=Roseomonas sp. AR75 TaxID=2562311 RepID=UPI001484D24B|nr:cupin domain-containing protein [Roseomonas sp. AR75]
MLDAVTRGVALLPAETGEVLDIFGLGLVVKVEPHTGGLFVAEHQVPPGLGVPLHVHDADDEVFVIRSGSLTLLGPEGGHVARPGDTVLLPRGVAHGFRNDGDTPVSMQVMLTPGTGAAAMFRALHRATRSAGPGGPAPAEIGAICAAHGVRFAPPTES